MKRLNSELEAEKQRLEAEIKAMLKAQEELLFKLEKPERLAAKNNQVRTVSQPLKQKNSYVTIAKELKKNSTKNF